MTGFLLDTNIISELIRSRPDPQVIAWIKTQAAGELFLSSMTIGELMRGAKKLGDTPRGARLQQWVQQDVVSQFKQRILVFDEPAAIQWGCMMGKNDASGTPLPAADVQIAAIAIVNKLTVVTRNTRDFERMLETVINPFTAAAE